VGWSGFDVCHRLIEQPEIRQENFNYYKRAGRVRGHPNDSASLRPSNSAQYRTRLVTDGVTGKLDVRPAARHFPLGPFAQDPKELTEANLEETNNANN
jgi:hypothetical protein